MRVTSTQIARELGVSRSTVSRALNGYPHVNETLRQRVLELAGQKKYQPNRAAQSMARGEHILIGVVVYTRPREYWEQVLRGVSLAERQLRDYGVVVEKVVTDISRPEEQVRALEDLVARGAKAIVVAPSAPHELAATIDKLMNAGIQIVLLNTDVPESKRLCYIGSDYVQSGKLSGELVCRYLGGKGRVAVIAYDDTGSMIPQKLTGFREELSRFSAVEMLGPYKFSRVGDHLYEDVRALLEEEKPDAVFMTYGQLEDVARAVEDAGLANKLPVVGYDVTSQVIEDLRKRVISAVIGQEPEHQGVLSINVLYDFLARGIRPKSSVIHARLVVVTAQNAGYYRKEALNAFTYYYL